jgi:transposase
MLQYKYRASKCSILLYYIMHAITAAQKARVIALLNSGTSAYKIFALTGVSTSTISRLRSEHCPDLPKSFGGRPAKLTPANISYAKRIIRMRKVDNAVQVTKALRNVTNQPLSSQTVRRQLRKSGLRPVVKRKRPLLKPHHRRARLDFAQSHQEWTLEDWKRVIWSDETKINRLGSDGRKWVWKEVGEALSDRLVQGTVKFGGGNVMMWGCMSWDGVGYATRIEGKMDAELYVSILEDELQETLRYYDKTTTDVIFQQDNDPKHTSKRAQTWFKDHDFTVMRWPPQSPDINPIEHLWDHIKRKLDEYENPPNSLHELWERVEREWEAIDKSVCQRLIESMPRRIAAVLKAKGGYTKY